MFKCQTRAGFIKGKDLKLKGLIKRKVVPLGKFIRYKEYRYAYGKS